ncbi:MAG: hypothetical protein KKA41_16595, partial [Proteobacteria bacterium]|nr:hypothetical protein [Pseudomonadota bacterium]
MPKFNHQNFGDIQKYVYLLARVLSVNGADDTASLALTDTALVASGIPIFFHCAMDSEQRENGALVGAAGAFREEDSVIVRCRLDDSGATITPVCVVARDQGPRTCCEWFEEIGSTICQNHNWRVPYAIPYYQLNPPGDDGWFAMCGTLPYYKLWTATLGGLGLFLIEVDCSLSDGKYHAKNKVNILRESDRFFEEYPYGLYWKASDNPGDLPQKDGVLKFNFSNVQTEVYRGEGAIDHVDYLRGQVYIKIFWDSGLPVEIIVSRSIYSYHD